MAGSSITVTRTPLKSREGRKIEQIQVAWVSDSAAGTVLIAMPDTLYGWLVKVVTQPGAGGVAPTSYNLKLIDALDTLASPALDALAGSCATRSATVCEQKQPIIASGIVPVLLCGNYTFSIDSAGNSKQGTAWFFLADSL